MVQAVFVESSYDFLDNMRRNKTRLSFSEKLSKSFDLELFAVPIIILLGSFLEIWNEILDDCLPIAKRTFVSSFFNCIHS